MSKKIIRMNFVKPRICTFWFNVLLFCSNNWFMIFPSHIFALGQRTLNFFVRTAVRQNFVRVRISESNEHRCRVLIKKIYHRKAPWPLTWQIIFIRLCAEHKTKYEGNGARDDDKIKVRTRELLLRHQSGQMRGEIFISRSSAADARCVCVGRGVHAAEDVRWETVAGPLQIASSLWRGSAPPKNHHRTAAAAEIYKIYTPQHAGHEGDVPGWDAFSHSLRCLFEKFNSASREVITPPWEIQTTSWKIFLTFDQYPKRAIWKFTHFLFDLKLVMTDGIY